MSIFRMISGAPRAILTLLAVLTCGALLLGGCVVKFEKTTVEIPDLQLTVTETEPHVRGTWTGRAGKGRISSGSEYWFHIGIHDAQSGSRHGVSRPVSDFPALLADESHLAPIEFEYTSDAGTISFGGHRTGNRLNGEFTLRPSADFASQITGALTEAPKGIEPLLLALHDMRADDVRAIASTGIRPTAADVIRLRSSGVNADFIKEVRKSREFSVDEIIQLRRAGVHPDFPSEIHRAGYDFDADAIVQLRRNGVSAGDAAAWKAAKFNFDATQLVTLRRNGVQPGLGKAAQPTLGTPTADDLVALRRSGVSEQFLQDMQHVKGQYSAADLVTLRRNGVTPDYAAEWRNAGIELSAEDLATLRRHGVPSSYASAIKVPDRKPLSVEAIIKLRKRGLTPEEIRELRQ